MGLIPLFAYRYWQINQTLKLNNGNNMNHYDLIKQTQVMMIPPNDLTGRDSLQLKTKL